MAERTHTQGDWFSRALHPEEGNHEVFVYDKQEQCAIRLADVRDKFDARLMAAAPDLLKSLQEAMSYWWPDGRAEQKAFDRAQAAIAKARNEA